MCILEVAISSPSHSNCGKQDVFDGHSGDWIVLHTRNRQEKALAEELDAMRIRCFLPLTTEMRYHGGRKATVHVPVFPGYLFLRGSLDDAYRADRTRRVVKIIPVFDQAALQTELLNLHRVLVAGKRVHRRRALECGMPVEVTAGALRGLRGVVEDLQSKDRVILQVKTLGSAVSVDVDADWVALID